MISVAVFAHNESRSILRCLSSLENNESELSVFVLINGSTYDTKELVESAAVTKSWIKYVEIPLGDKSNAWNVFIHSIAQPSDAYVFVDGDCYVNANGIDHLIYALNSLEGSLASAAFPGTGRSREVLTQMIHRSAIVGGMYALSKEAVQVIWDKEICIPIGFIGDDSLLDYLLATDFKCGPNDIARHKIVPAPKAMFYFDPISPLKILDYVKYFKRRIRYSTRHFQCQILIPLLKKHGLASMPKCIVDLYPKRETHKLRLRSGLDFFFDFIALCKMKITIFTR